MSSGRGQVCEPWQPTLTAPGEWMKWPGTGTWEGHHHHLLWESGGGAGRVLVTLPFYTKQWQVWTDPGAEG